MNADYLKLETTEGYVVCVDSIIIAIVRRHDDAEKIVKCLVCHDDFLLVCQRILEAAPYVSDYDVPLGLWDHLKAVIAKAEGRS